MRKIDLIFILLMMIELIIVVALSFMTCYWPTPCSTPDFLHPFGRNYEGGCIQVLAPAHCSVFYLSSDVLILTIITYLSYLIYNKFIEKIK